MIHHSPVLVRTWDTRFMTYWCTRTVIWSHVFSVFRSISLINISGKVKPKTNYVFGKLINNNNAARVLEFSPRVSKFLATLALSPTSTIPIFSIPLCFSENVRIFSASLENGFVNVKAHRWTCKHCPTSLPPRITLTPMFRKVVNCRSARQVHAFERQALLVRLICSTWILQLGAQEGMITALLQIIANDNVELCVSNALFDFEI